MRTRLVMTAALVTLSSAVCLQFSGADDSQNQAGNSPPRYKLEVGQELSYSLQSEFKYENGSLNQSGQWKFWVVKRNDDGSWRLIVRQQTGYDRSTPRTEFAWLDLAPDGTFTPNASLGFRVDPTSLLIQLPPQRDHAENGWKSTVSMNDKQQSFRLSDKQPQDGKLAIDVEVTSPMDEIYLSTNTATALFDVERGLIERIDSENTQGYGFNGKGTGLIELTSVKSRDGQWVRQFAQQAEQFFSAVQQYEQLTEAAQHDPLKSQSLLDEAKQKLASAKPDDALPEIAEQFDHRIDQHDSMASYYLDSAKRRAQVVGKPAFEFDTTDIDGNQHALIDYRGKVVVLDFWYRGCGWCIRAMPQIKQLHEQFKDQPVVVFGMNTDSKEEDARFVIDKMELAYANLHAQGLPEKYQVRGFPTLILIDQKGAVHDIHVGYSPDLAEKVGRQIEQLLAES